MSACTIKDRVVIGHARRMGHGGHCALFGFPYLVNQDGLAGFFSSLHELAAVGYILQIDADDFGLVVLKIIDQIGFVHIALVADADHFVHADNIVIKRFHGQDSHTAALNNVRDAARDFKYLIHLD